MASFHSQAGNIYHQGYWQKPAALYYDYFFLEQSRKKQNMTILLLGFPYKQNVHALGLNLWDCVFLFLNFNYCYCCSCYIITTLKRKSKKKKKKQAVERQTNDKQIEGKI